MKKRITRMFCVLLAVLFVTCSFAVNAVWQKDESFENSAVSDGKTCGSQVGAEEELSMFSEDGGILYMLRNDGTAAAAWSRPGTAEAEIKNTVSENGKEYTVTEISASAFYMRTELESIAMPDSVETVGARAFFGCASLKTVSADGIKKTGTEAFTGTPFALSGEFVTLGESLVNYNGESKTVKVPEGIKYISDAFAYNNSVITVILPESVKTVGDGAFACAVKLKNVSLPQSLSEIGDRAFFGCTSLGAVSICSEVSKIGADALTGTPYLASLSEGDGDFLTVGNGVLLKYYGKDKDVTVPSSVKYISDAFAFSQTVQTVMIPESCSSIGSGAFKGCPHLSRVIIEGDLKEIGPEAFEKCPQLRGAVFCKSAPEKLAKRVFSEVSDFFAVYCSDVSDGFEIFRKTGIPVFSPLSLSED